MNTSSRLRRLLALTAMTVLVACIQGPWDYYPDNPAPFRGVTVTAYALAGRPITDVCFERLLGLAEEATQAYAFYDSADVRITGSFGGTMRTLVLTAKSDTPNCFTGDSLALVERGRNYDMVASLTWDSAGRKVTSVLTSTARVPTDFSVDTTAAAPRLAKLGGIPADIFTPQFLAALPPDVRAVMVKEYGDTLSKLVDDTVAMRKYLKVNGGAIRARLLGLLERDYEPYDAGDTLFYLNGALNTLSHYFSANRSPDVNAVLITHRFDPDSGRPQTVFDSPLGFEPDSGEYYFPGDRRRLLVYADMKGSKGWNLLDSMGVVNVYFHTGLNTLYFYGMEKAYYDFLSTMTQVEGGGGGDADPRVIPKFNVTGGRGVFVGGIPDSFHVNIRSDQFTKTYSLPRVHGLFCRDEGWLSNKDCRGYYREWCSNEEWKGGECRVDAIRASLEADAIPDTVLKSRSSLMADSARKDTAAVHKGENLFCVERNFSAPGAACAASKAECLETKGINGCKQSLWDYCKDNNWRPDQCRPGLASYCRDNPRLSETLCKQADKWCADPVNAGSAGCK